MAGYEEFKPKTSELTLKFENQKAAEHFLVWLSEAGEQDYWNYMECREEEEEGLITGTQFNYHEPGGGIVIIKCGRLDSSD